MFLKLLKYEFKNLNHWYLGMYGLILFLSVVTGFWIGNSIDDYNGFFATSASIDQNPITGLIFLSFVILFVALSISTLFLIIRRFKHSLFHREGYLTLTLPVNHHQLILSKLAGALIWSLLSALALSLSLLIIFSIVFEFTGAPPGITFLGFLQELIRFLEIPFHIFTQTFLSLLLATISGILLIYTAISIGQLFQNHRTAIALFSYFGMYIVLYGIFYPAIMRLIPYNAYDDYPISLILWIQILFHTVLSGIYYSIIYYILKNKVNLH